MKLLVVDNITKGLPDIKKALKGYDYDIIRYNEVNNDIIKKYDKIILSGGHAFNVLHRNKKYKKELNLIKKTKKPILGICLGFQLICRTYGSNMVTLAKYEHGLSRIKKIKDDAILKDINNHFWVFENHRHMVKKVNKQLVVLAESNTGIEMIRHKSKPVWGTQFHPEHFVRKNVGRKVLSNFLNS